MDSTILALIFLMLIIFVAPFLFRVIEHNLEFFFLIMGALALTISNLWSVKIIEEALIEPIKIALAVLTAGMAFRFLQKRIRLGVNKLIGRLGVAPIIFLVVVILGLISSIITAIIASLILCVIVEALSLSKSSETNLIIIACLSIGLGAALTPIGEPLSTIATAKLNADFFFLFRLLSIYIIPGIFLLGIISALFFKYEFDRETVREEGRVENPAEVIWRALKVYVFVMALILLGEGFKPVIDTYIVKFPPSGLYWINIVSAVLDNATLTAAEISPKMDLTQVKFALISLLASGVILIPGNIPNIISAGKLKIGMRSWAKLGVPLGVSFLIIYFIFLSIFK